MSRARRDLSAQDLKLWRHVTRSVSAYRAQPPAEAESVPEKEAPIRQSKQNAAPQPAARAPSSPPPLMFGRTADMDRRQAKRFKRGELPVDARIDLHGMTLERAHAALTAFIRNAHGHGARLVVVITGKGDPKKSSGRIRTEAPHWLNQADVRALIMAVTEARSHHGGGGALYVLLKRQRPRE